MDASRFATELRETIEQLKASGVDDIKCENLIHYLSSVSRDLAASDTYEVELYKAKLQKWVEEHKNEHAKSVEMFRSVITAGQNALRTAFLMNGGAAVAMLAFIGHLATKTPDKVSLFACCLAIFVSGVLISVVASGSTYLSQWFYLGAEQWKQKAGFALNVVSIILAILSYIVFACGIREAYDVLTNFT